MLTQMNATARSTPVLHLCLSRDHLIYVIYASPLFLFAFQKFVSIKMNSFIGSLGSKYVQRVVTRRFVRLLNNIKQWITVSVGFNLS